MSLHGSTSDFFTLAPVEPVTFRVLPDDFDAKWIEFYANLPDADEIEECRACQHRDACRPGSFARPECRERDININWRGIKPKRITRGHAREDTTALLCQLLEQGPATAMQMSEATGMGYWAIYKLLGIMLDDGRVVCIGQNFNRKGGPRPGKVYALRGWES